MSALVIVMAFGLDLMLGDPRWLPHPVVGIGKLIAFLEPRLRRMRSERVAGMVLWGIVVGLAFFATWAILRLLPPVWQDIASVVLLYYCLATRGLADAAYAVLRPLQDGDLQTARRELRSLCGRDADNLNEKEIVRAVVESVAENTVDGVLAPLFFAFLGGPPLALAYKAVNTLDSMVGYKDERYLRFGWFSARMDDLANLIPARLSVLFLGLGALPSRASVTQAIRVGFRDGAKNPSPNSGYPEAAMAGALGVQLGGPATYRGSVSDKPYLGDRTRELEYGDVAKSVAIMKAACFAFLLLGSALCLALRGWGR